MEPRQDVHDDYAERYQSEICQMVWAHCVGEALALQEPEGQDLHPVALADPDVLEVDPQL